MSMTTTMTTTTVAASLPSVLADYQTFRSDPQPALETASTASTAVTPSETRSSGPSWPTDHRRMPPYRPINYNIDLGQRLTYNSGIEHAFISTMFFGIRVVTVRDSWQQPARLSFR